MYIEDTTPPVPLMPPESFEEMTEEIVEPAPIDEAAVVKYLLDGIAQRARAQALLIDALKDQVRSITPLAEVIK